MIGEALIDLVEDRSGAERPDRSTYTALPAGSPLNIAVGLRRLECPTALLARFSSSALGAQIRRYAERCDLDLSTSVDAAEPATLAFASLDAQGKSTYDFYAEGTADWGWQPEEFQLPPSVRVVQAGSLTSWMDPGAGRLADWWERLAAAGEHLLSYDPNVRTTLGGGRSRVAPKVERMVAASHLVKASDDDLAFLYPGEPLADVAARWLGTGPRLVVVTRGANGCLAFTAAMEPVTRPAVPVEVVDTIGAGDAFASGLLSGLVDAGIDQPDALAAADGAAISAAVERALLVSALTCERAGARPPTRSELRAAEGRRTTR